MKKIYFLCTGNSCRSQIAEGFAKKHFPSHWEVRSAGIETHGLNPKAVATMKEAGIDITTQTSDLIDPDFFQQADFIVTLCGDAADNCPIIPTTTQYEHWDLSDPGKATGTDQEIAAAFSSTREDIKERMMQLVKRLD